MAWKGYFRPRNPEKYAGNADSIVYRSKIELKLMNVLDTHPDVISWSSEEFCIPYTDKTSNRVRRYFPDFLYKTKKETFVVEVKYHEEAVMPTLTEGKTKKKFQTEMLTWAKNQCKWEAAKNWCELKGYKFVVITDKQLGVKY